MITQSYLLEKNNSKINTSLINNKISCYKRPHLNYQKKSDIKNNKSFDANKENININSRINKTNKKNNFFRITKKGNININNNTNNKKNNSLSRNIAILCGIINSMNNIKTNKKINNNIKNLFIQNKINNEKLIIKIQKWWKKMVTKIKKIKLIQKTWRKYLENKTNIDYYYFSFKKIISPKEKTINSSINLIKSFKDEEIIIKEYNNINDNNMNNNLIKLRKKFIFYITQRLSRCFILILSKLNLFNFIKILNQRITKKINQYLFYSLFDYTNNINNNNTLIENKNSFFFETLKRHLKVNINLDSNNINEISILLRTNIPKYFQKNFNKKYIPFITPTQEKNLINTQLFLFNNEKLINYILYFYNNEKKIEINEQNFWKQFIKNDLNMNKMKNRNIFGVMKYIDMLESKYNRIKLKIYKESYHSENVDDNDCDSDDDNYSNNCVNIINKKKFRFKFNC